MALTGTETYGTVVPGFVTDLDGNLRVTYEGSEQGTVVPGFLTDSDGRLVVTPNADDPALDRGFVRNADGSLLVTTDSSQATWDAGFLRDPDGALVVGNEQGETGWFAGFLRNSSSALAVSGMTVTITRINLAPRAVAQATHWGAGFINATNNGSALGGGAWAPDSGNNRYYVKGTATAGGASVYANLGHQSTNYVPVTPGEVYFLSVDINMLQRGAAVFQAFTRFYNDVPSFVTDVAASFPAGLTDDRVTWRVTVPANATRMFVFAIGQVGTLANGEVVEFSVADLLIEKQVAFNRIGGEEVRDNYAGKADGPLVEADTGQEWQVTNSGSGGSLLTARIKNETVTWEAAAASAVATYAEVETTDTAHVVGATFRHSEAGANNDGASVIFIGMNPISGGALSSLDMSCHLPISRFGWTFDVWQSSVLVNLGSGSFSPNLAADTEHSAQIRIAGNAAYVELPDGTSRVFRHPWISSEGGPWPDMELYANNASTATVPAFTEFWADSRVVDPMELPGVGFFPTADQLSEGSATWNGTANASASTFTLELTP